MNSEHDGGHPPYQPSSQPSTTGSSPASPHPTADSGHGSHTPKTPYDFILNTEHHPPKTRLGGSRAVRILVVVLGIGVLLGVAALVVSLMTPKDSATTLATSLAQEQAEIVRVADQGVSYATAQNVKDTAITVSTSVANDQADTLKYLSTNKITLKPKDLAIKHDTATDQLLTNARASSTFDSVWEQTMTTKLKVYQTDLRTLYGKTRNKDFKDSLKKAFDSTKLLLELLARQS